MFLVDSIKKGCEPAGEQAKAAAVATPSSAGQQAEGAAYGLIIENDRDRRVFDWLRNEVPQQELFNAISAIPVGRRPYLSAVVKILRLEVPEHLQRPSQQQVSEYLAKIRSSQTKSVRD